MIIDEVVVEVMTVVEVVSTVDKMELIEVVVTDFVERTVSVVVTVFKGRGRVMAAWVLVIVTVF